MRRRRTSRAKAQSFGVVGDHITLGQFLQAAGIVGSGGEAKAFLTDVTIRVNGEDEARRGRKLRAGDLVEMSGVGRIRLTAGEADNAEQEEESDLPDDATTADNSAEADAGETAEQDAKGEAKDGSNAGQEGESRT